jgi:hypothetical protein
MHDGPLLPIIQQKIKKPVLYLRRKKITHIWTFFFISGRFGNKFMKLKIISENRTIYFTSEFQSMQLRNILPSQFFQVRVSLIYAIFFNGGIFLDFFMYCAEHCFICRSLDSTFLSEDAGIKSRTLVTSALAARRSNHTDRSSTLG